MIREPHRGDNASALCVGDIERSAFAVQRSQARARIRKSDAAGSGGARRETRPVVAHREHEVGAFPARANVERTRIRPARDAVPQCVFHQRLEQETRHGRSGDRGLDFDARA